MSQKTLFEHAGGTAGLHRLEDYSYASVLADPLLKPLFGAGSRFAPQNLNAAADGDRTWDESAACQSAVSW
jgi:truncated hemoglobin YjbI